MTTKDELREWFDAGVAEGRDRMIIVCDTFDYSDFQVYADDPAFDEQFERINSQDMQRIMEVYDLHADREEQMAESRVWREPSKVETSS